jgi:N-acetylglucosaminyldiphosphoundecaprenol N-acetyl-beta-D-mannosaminyltransferase
MFTIELTYLNSLHTYLGRTKLKYALLYADFNVINYLYNSKLNLNNPNIILYPDSTAIYIAMKLFTSCKYSKLVSTDLLDQSLQEFIRNKNSLFFFGDSNDVVKRAVEKLKSINPDINISGFCSGYSYSDEETIKQINLSNAEILFVGLGAGRQEKWIVENYDRLNCKLIISCGGWFQFLSGSRRRAPKLLRKIQLEWLYKFISEFPRVWKRYLLGVLQFYFRIITKRIFIIIKK